MILDTTVLYYVNTGLIDLGLHSRSKEYEKTKTSAPIVSQSFQSIWMEFAIMLKFVDVIHLILILFCPFNDK